MENFIEYVEKGMLGLNKGIPFVKGLEFKIPQGITKKKYYLIGAGSGVGKTTFADEQFILNLFLRKANVKWIYFSFEISSFEKRCLFLSYFINHYEGIDIPSSKIKGEEGVLNNEEFELVKKYYPIVEELFEKIDFYEEPLNYVAISKIIRKYAEENGTIGYKTFIKNGIEFREIETYVENDPTLTTIVIIDHISLIDDVSNKTSKQSIDLVSKELIRARNKFGFSSVVVQQFNGDIENYYRTSNKDFKAIIPTRKDFSDSSYTFRDADVVIGGIQPSQLMIPNYLGYEINKIKNSSFWHILKNRYSPIRGVVPLIRCKNAPTFELLPDYKNIRYTDYAT